LTWRFCNKILSNIGMMIVFGVVAFNAFEHILVRL
jgi:hypothetical protein